MPELDDQAPAYVSSSFSKQPADSASLTELFVEAAIQQGISGNSPRQLTTLVGAPRVHLQHLCELTTYIRETHSEVFEELHGQLELSETTAYGTFVGVTDELFKGGISWGRIATLLSFVGFVARRCHEQDLHGLVPSLTGWTKRFFKSRLFAWIEQVGGWDGFDNHFRDFSPKTSSVFSAALKMGTAAVAIGLTTALLCH